ncbi:MAG: protein translocase subunit SecF [Mycobacteriales bacterium]
MAGRGLAHRLYTGQVSFDFIGRRRWWYLGSGVVMLVSILSLAIGGINPSISFKGGAQFSFPAARHTSAQVRSALTDAGVNNATVVTVGAGSDRSFQVQTRQLSNAAVTNVEHSIQHHLGVAHVSITTVGATWGSQITGKALEGLVVFLVLVVVYLSMRFEPKMALAAMVALIHDLVITAGIYSLSRLQVSPSTVIALLTILGYSLYDTVVVFDKVRENTAGLSSGSRMTFTEAANLAVNQTLVRSINTSVIALLPVAGLLIIGAGLLGAGSLNDLSLALFIGLASGAYSSIFIATPLLADMKEREDTYRMLARRVRAARDTAARRAAEPVAAVAVAGVGDLSRAGEGAGQTRTSVGRPARGPAPRRNSRGRAGRKKRR